MRFTQQGEGRVVEVIFNDGGLNLLSKAALHELRKLLPSFSAAEVVLFRSGRPRLFAAGADMAEMAAFDGWSAHEFARLGQELFAAIESLAAATVCFIDGDCFGGALDLSLTFDLRVATARSRFSHPGARISIVTGFGGTGRWKQVMPAVAAGRLFLTNAVFSADEARNSGLVDGIAADPAAVIETILDSDRATGRFVKELSNLSPRLSRDEQLLFARRLSHIYFPLRAEG